RNAHTSLIYGKGIPMGVAVVDMAIDYNVITKKGAWLAYKGETLGQGKETVANFLAEHPELQQEIIDAIMAEVGKGMGLLNVNPDSDEDTDGEAEGADDQDNAGVNDLGEFEFDSTTEDNEIKDGESEDNSGEEILDLDEASQN
ncbi:MAG: hypothetical protein IJG62_00155, partial [Synergistaceae bacterium]|nr:hypothetical protein [Synergistaceae bacterium]